MLITIENNDIEVNVADTFWKKTIGLMGKTHINKPLLFMFDKDDHYGIHTYGMKIPIDVLFLSKDFKVVDQYLYLEPNKSVKSKVLCRYVLEKGIMDIVTDNESRQPTTR